MHNLGWKHTFVRQCVYTAQYHLKKTTTNKQTKNPNNFLKVSNLK